ncbi:hypothetical protein MAPG_04046 [Magnaporthiopsis poae ATCC 64411]|uniref:Endoglucanase n=1 Tax=Magnaporthiopsis poae (strain ATCC 64411 / 73-15) TaxID=644358 RepID=A0A0C4DVN7_MAGP6|nr:hypothetical protein MAPG_04046 [Magnaporthiopsis poae ATCC 64411]
MRTRALGVAVRLKRDHQQHRDHGFSTRGLASRTKCQAKKNALPAASSSSGATMRATNFCLWAVTALAGTTQAHMYMEKPPALGGVDNPSTQLDDRDYALSSPLANGIDFPCRGNHKLLGTASGATVAKWQAGSTYELVINGSAPHGGGSCQASLSYDGGRTFNVIHTWMGACPGPGPFKFQIPPDAPSGQSLFAWTWLNRIGFREFYMNCASVEITGGGGCGEKVAFGDRPAPFLANLNNGCLTVEDSDPLIPDPGPNVDKTGNQFADPVGNCTVTKRQGSPANGACTSPVSRTQGPNITPTAGGSNPNAAQRKAPGISLIGVVALNAAAGWWLS